MRGLFHAVPKRDRPDKLPCALAGPVSFADDSTSWPSTRAYVGTSHVWGWANSSDVAVWSRLARSATGVCGFGRVLPHCHRFPLCPAVYFARAADVDREYRTCEPDGLV